MDPFALHIVDGGVKPDDHLAVVQVLRDPSDIALAVSARARTVILLEPANPWLPEALMAGAKAPTNSLPACRVIDGSHTGYKRPGLLHDLTVHNSIYFRWVIRPAAIRVELTIILSPIKRGASTSHAACGFAAPTIRRSGASRYRS